MKSAGIACVLGALLLVAAGAGFCHARSITIDDFFARIRVEDSAEVIIEESITLRFEGSWQGIHRRIPVLERTRQGLAHRLLLQVEGISDGAGNPFRYESSWAGEYRDLKIFVPGAADAVRTVVIRYRLKNGIRFFEDHDELYWNVTGDEWPYPILQARAAISLPGKLDNLRVNAFTGAYGSTGRDAEITLDGASHEPDLIVGPAAEAAAPVASAHEVLVRTTRPLGIRQGLTVAVAWNPGILPRPTGTGLFWTGLIDNLAALVSWLGWWALAPLLALGWLTARWRMVGRDPRPGPVVVAYEPPAGMGPGEVGTLVDNSSDMRDIMAVLVDLAVRGVIRIRQQPGRTSRAYTFELLKPTSEWAGLGTIEQSLLAGLFGAAGEDRDADGIVAQVKTQDLEQNFYAHLPAIQSAIFTKLIAQGCYQTRPDLVRKQYLGFAGVLFLASVANGFSELRSLAAVGCGILTALCIAAFGLIMPARTTKGAAARDAIVGFEEFLRRVDAHRLASLPLTPELFERYLPYAMALNVDRRWAKAFEGICTQPPQWYVGDGPITTFDSSSFSSDMRAMGACAAAAMQSAPRSSDSSGFSGGGGDTGGGSSGGGGGGGGGAGF